MSTVFIRNASYNYTKLKPLVFEFMDALGGGRIQKNSRVVIKPNFLAPEPPERAIVTHPMILRTVVEYVLDRGAVAQVSDSSAVGSFDKILRVTGVKEELSGLPVEYREFKHSLSVDVGKPFEKVDIAADAVNADFLINLPKLKTHTQMLLTLGVKNLFGCIVGMSKPEWHFRTGVNREMFAQLLVKIHQSLNPSITLVDGILAMEGQGPGKRGEPRELGLLLGSTSAPALDITISRMLGIEPELVPTNKILLEQGLSDSAITVDGDLPEITDFKLPEITPLVFGPKRMHGFMRRHLIQRPECDDSLCKLCGECWKYCPAEAITPKSKKVHFNYDVCIRCYCCIEVCPHGALRAAETVTGKLARKILKM